MVVGAGRFGANYPRVLSQLGIEAAGVGAESGFRRLVVTRTHLAAARQTAALIAQMPDSPFESVEGVEVAARAQLERALERYRPILICITARDPQSGDAIHARYAPAALAFGAVLCEKPFSRADDRRAPVILRQLIAHPQAPRFGLHLPMAVALEAMLAHTRLKALLYSARRIEFIWERLGNGTDLINDLALHPWSLIPERDDLQVSTVERRGEQVEIAFQTPQRAGRMILRGRGSFRGMRLDDQVLRFEFSAGQLHVRECAADWPAVLSGSRAVSAEYPIVSVDNPLKAHILALMAGRPLVGLARTLQSQLFLAEACDRL